MAKTCRYMNNIALPIFMRRMHLPLDPERKKCIIDFNLMSWDTGLSALAIYFSQATLETFVCVISKTLQNLRGNDNPISSRFLSRRVDQVSHLMSLILSVKDIYMVFDVDLGRLTFLQHFAMQRLMLAVHDFVGFSMRKSCNSFHIADLYAYPFEKAYEFQSVNNDIASRWQNLAQFCVDALPINRKHLGHQLRGNGWKYRKVLESNLLPRPFLPSVPSPNYLTRMDLNCHFLLVPPFSTWLFDLLQSSNITSLTLSLMKPMKEEEFRRYALPRLITSLPQLIQLNVAYDELGFFKAIIGSLHLFTLLQDLAFAPLSFDRLSPLPMTNTPNRNIAIRHLTSFTGFSEQAAFLFSQPFSFTSLSDVNIIIDWYFNYHVSLYDLSRHFSIITHRFSKLEIKPCVSVCMADHDRCPVSPTPSQQREFAASFDAVTRLTLELPYFLPEVHSQIEDVLAWLHLFRRLRELTLCISCLKANTAETNLRYVPTIAAIKASLPHAKVTPVYNSGNYHHHWSNSRRPKDRIFYYLSSSVQTDATPYQLQNCFRFGSSRAQIDSD